MSILAQILLALGAAIGTTGVVLYFVRSGIDSCGEYGSVLTC